jgi:phosphopentomutase
MSPNPTEPLPEAPSVARFNWFHRRPKITRAIVIVMDSVGIGELPDAVRYADGGSNTVGNIAKTIPLEVPTLRELGLGRLVSIGGTDPSPRGAYGRMVEASAGKDSVTGHWEMAGIILDEPFPTFPRGFPTQKILEFEERIGRKTLGNVVASGTAIIDSLGPEHVESGAPIVYTSADSVFQIAAHEDVIDIDEQYRICHVAFEIFAAGLGVARVIARPFVGEPGAFRRTPNRRDFALPPVAETLLDRLSTAGRSVLAIGKIEDLFAGRGVSRAVHTTSDAHGMEVLEAELVSAEEDLVFVNLVDFDTQFGHRNDVAGYAANLERFDRDLARLLPRLRDSDLLFVTADHGNDPTTPSTDHSREYVPVLVYGAAVGSGIDLGTRSTFADLGQTVADVFGIRPLAAGTSFLGQILR